MKDYVDRIISSMYSKVDRNTLRNILKLYPHVQTIHWVTLERWDREELLLFEKK